MKAPATAVMTQQQRGRVEEVLAQLRQAQVSSVALPGQSLLLLAGPYMDLNRCYASQTCQSAQICAYYQELSD